MALRRYVGSRLTLAGLLLSIFLIATVNATTFYSLGLSMTATVKTPDVVLQSGNVANSTIFTGGTSGRVTTPTLNYPTGNNTVKGTWVSGTVPASVSAVDSNYFTYQSASQGATQKVAIDLIFHVSSVSPTQFNLTLVQQYTIASVPVIIQFFNYTSNGWAGTTEQGYLTYTSSATPSTDETNSLTVTTNPKSYMSAGVSKIEITASVGGNPPQFNQKVNFVRLYYYQQTYNYVLKVVNQQPTSYNVRLNSIGLTQSNIARLSNFTAWFNGTSPVQLQVLNGNLTISTGSLNTLGGSSTLLVSVRVTASSPGLSTIDSYLQIYLPGTSTHTDYRLTFKIT